jgi:hypothetical protein
LMRKSLRQIKTIVQPSIIDTRQRLTKPPQLENSG